MYVIASINILEFLSMNNPGFTFFFLVCSCRVDVAAL